MGPKDLEYFLKFISEFVVKVNFLDEQAKNYGKEDNVTLSGVITGALFSIIGPVTPKLS